MTITDLDFYQSLALRGWTTSHRDYSSYYLGMNASYVAQRGDRGLSERALINLFRRLWEERHFLLAAKVAWAILFGGPDR